MLAAVLQSKEVKEDMDIIKWHSELSYEEWMALPVSGSRPSARYKVILSSAFFFCGIGSRVKYIIFDYQQGHSYLIYGCRF